MDLSVEQVLVFSLGCIVGELLIILVAIAIKRS
jgi:hypothetical protein